MNAGNHPRPGSDPGPEQTARPSETPLRQEGPEQTASTLLRAPAAIRGQQGPSKLRQVRPSEAMFGAGPCRGLLPTINAGNRPQQSPAPGPSKPRRSAIRSRVWSRPLPRTFADDQRRQSSTAEPGPGPEQTASPPMAPLPGEKHGWPPARLCVPLTAIRSQQWARETVEPRPSEALSRPEKPRGFALQPSAASKRPSSTL